MLAGRAGGISYGGMIPRVLAQVMGVTCAELGAWAAGLCDVEVSMRCQVEQ